MATPELSEFIADVFAVALKRMPTERELLRWTGFLQQGHSSAELLRTIMCSQEYKKKQGVKTAFPAGHYYSPIVDPTSVGAYVKRRRHLNPNDLAGIALSTDDMLAFWKANLATICSTQFPDTAGGDKRFHYKNGSFPFGDAIMLRTMLVHCKPSRIVEIGSGYTTACMLDTIDETGLTKTIITCIEPYADRLRGLLRSEDLRIVTLIETAVQTVEIGVFETLEAGDILFIDSTHVVKTGSDVHYELFHVLPALKPGVIIHFHDVPFPFEYPDEWVFSSNYSWNEAYVLQAFLMYNDRFRVTMWNSMFAREHRSVILQDFPLFLNNPGSSIWLEKLR